MRYHPAAHRHRIRRARRRARFEWWLGVGMAVVAAWLVLGR